MKTFILYVQLDRGRTLYHFISVIGNVIHFATPDPE
jgi:hypothetical protein